VDDDAAVERLRVALAAPEQEINLASAALLLAELAYPGLGHAPYLDALDDLAVGLRRQLGSGSPAAAPAVLGRYMGQELGFRGNAEDYYAPANSYLHEVLQRRGGLPITLSVIYIEVGRRAGLQVQGIGFPYHFIVGVSMDAETHYLDPFGGGRELTRADLAAQLCQTAGRVVPLEPAMLRPLGKPAIIVRMLYNLKQAYLRRGELELALRVSNRLRALLPHDRNEQRDRSLLLYHLSRWQEARQAMTEYLALVASGPDATAIHGLLTTVEMVLGSVN
jgi:regulator of sirC expression with transglutaminase-like and TPR domain